MPNVAGKVSIHRLEECRQKAAKKAAAKKKLQRKSPVVEWGGTPNGKTRFIRQHPRQAQASKLVVARNVKARCQGAPTAKVSKAAKTAKPVKRKTKRA